MSAEGFQLAKQVAFDLMLQYGQNQFRFARRPTARDFGDPDQLICRALAESQRLLHRASERVFSKKVAFLKSARNQQLAINCVHLVTGSAFIALIAGAYPIIIKWVGALVALAAGTVSLLLPRDLAALEREVFADASAVADLVGLVGKLQVELTTTRASQNDALAKEAADVIGKCLALAKKYELEKIAADSGLFSKMQSSESPGPP